MELNLNALSNLQAGDAKGKQLSETLSEPIIGRLNHLERVGEYKDTPTAQKPTESEKTGLNQLQREADKNRAEIERAFAICKEYQQNKVITSQIQAELLKGSKAGEDLADLYLKAVKAISLLIHNELFYNEIADAVRNSKDAPP